MSTLILTDDAAQDSTYKFISSKNGEMVLRDAASSLDEPRTFRISHQVSSDSNGVDRHLCQLVRTDDDGDGAPHSGSVHVVLAQPREGVTSANMLLEWEKLKNYIEANWADFVGGFLPDLT